MVITVIGGSGSGKSAYAEALAVSLAGGGPLYYLATMQIYDEEGERKAKRHRELRKGKGFTTIEQPVDIAEAAVRIKAENSTLLLECMSNLVANEMFPQDEPKQEESLDKESKQKESLNRKQRKEEFSGEKQKRGAEVAEKIFEDIRQLAGESRHLIVVTNNVFEDGIEYDAATASYMEALGKVNERLAAAADAVVEVVVGLPVAVKGAALLCRGEGV